VVNEIDDPSFGLNSISAQSDRARERRDQLSLICRYRKLSNSLQRQRPAV